jgi:hypothetical protein
VALLAGLLVPGWCVLSLLDLKGLSPLLALPASAGIGLSIVSLAAWLAWLSGTGMIGAAVLTALASIAAVAARIYWRTQSSPVPRPTPQPSPLRGGGERLFVVGAGALAALAAGISIVAGPWLGQSADSFYHMAAALRLLQENRAIPQDVFFGASMQYPDATSGTLHVALAWLSLIGGIVPAWKALAIFGSAFLALGFANFAREATRSASAALIAAWLYFLTSLYFDMRDMAYPDRIGQALGWLCLVFFLRFARAPRTTVTGQSRFPAWSRGYQWRELVPMCLLGFTSGSVYPGMAPLIVIAVLAALGFAALAALWRRDLRSLAPLAIACAAMLIVVLPVLAIRLLAALPQPGLDATLATYSPRLRVIVFHGYPFVDPRFWFGTWITITTVGTVCVLGRARRWWLDGDPGAALMWGGLLFVPAVAATPIVVNSANAIYALARIAFLLTPLLYVPLGWELSRLPELAAYIKGRKVTLAAGVPVVAGILLVAATTNVVASRLVIGVIPIYFGHGSRSISTTHQLYLPSLWADRLKALDAAGPGVILAGFETSYELAGLTGRTIVSVPRGHTPYQDEARDGALRRGDLSDAMKPSADPADLISVLVRYHVTFVMSDEARDGIASWDWIAAQKELTRVAAGKGWRLYRFDPALIDQALAIPINAGTQGGVAFFPSRAIAGRAVFVRIASAGQSGVAQVSLAGSSATYQVEIAVPAQAGATVTVPVLLPDLAPVDSYQVNVIVPGANPFKAGAVEVGHAYEAEYFAGAFQNYRRGFARNAGWEVLDNLAYHRQQAASALRVGAVATHPLTDAPGSYCLSIDVYDAGDGKAHSISVGLGGNAVGTSWSGNVKGVRELVMAASVGTSSHELSYWVPAGARAGAVIDRITLYPPQTCPPVPST